MQCEIAKKIGKFLNYVVLSTLFTIVLIPAVKAFDATVTLSDNSVDATAVSSAFEFINDTTVPSGGEIIVNFPSDFTMDDIVDATGELTLTDDSASVTITSADLTSNVLSIVVGAEITASSTINLSASVNVIDQNPSVAGQYGIQITTKDTESTTLDTGIAYADIDNEIVVTTTVQEALIMTIDDTSINLNVDPSVKNGEDYSQKTLLNVKTNAANGYKIQAQLQDSDTNATLKNGTHNINTGSVYDGSSYVPNVFTYLAYNADTTKDKAGLKTDLEATGSTPLFTSSSSDLTLYDGTASGVGFASNTNSQDHTIYYILYVDYQTIAGIYSGSVVYTAVPSF